MVTTLEAEFFFEWKPSKIFREFVKLETMFRGMGAGGIHASHSLASDHLELRPCVPLLLFVVLDFCELLDSTFKVVNGYITYVTSF
jgi:hypothetical protein